ncbi:MAG: Phosphoenolpyruvate synthase [Candidatus Shapirobacteria bacterium GW2011_GWE1_38_10]|uniref:Phosphoenolpyruvate synthase n=1 Tax=Candidatus Shapirobacteria bacterium GW2011_GWE1_38_10 TaxID=1618488 RepID=A0A0G0IHB2_9BACT|nr:MAG: Phosphoenolpyruvate synthase [Candidatus Shapirobacteria bacterium GW2011_GWE1_38_10]HBP51204.1 phosphoenolpyruvate synthase [Candidatus Shapirobacteria bacterium]
MIKKPSLLWFKDIHFEDVNIVGGKGANLGEMYNIGIPVPNGFCVTAEAYFKFIEVNKLKPKIKDILQSTDVDQPEQLSQASSKIRKLIKSAPIPQDIALEIMMAYKKLCSFGGLKDAPVAVRTSATAEDSADASFAGQGDTFLNVTGETNVVNQVRACWSSLFTSRSIFYQVKKHYDHFKIGVAVPVQKMVQSEVSGIVFTLNPVTNNKNEIVVETIWGLGEYIVQGIVTPDQHLIDKSNWEIKYKNSVHQDIQLTRFADSNKELKVPKYKQNKAKISDTMAVKIAKLSQKLHNHYAKAQDIEFAIEKGKLYFVQTRPITTVDVSQKNINDQNKIDVNLLPILTGEPASPGSASGIAVIIKDPKDITRVQKGQILITQMTTPDFVPAMKKVNGIITDKGGQTSHAAIVSRELGVPCVVGTTTATKLIKEGDIITIDGTTGKIYSGDHSSGLIAKKVVHTLQKTATKLYVNLGEPDLAKEISKRNVDGIGLLRAEFMIANIGVHPKRMIQEGRQKEYVEKLALGMAQFCKNFNPRPVIYRATDFKTNEYRYLKWGKQYEPEEPNPLLGFRGAIRYINSPDVFQMELDAIKLIRNKYNLKNLWLMIPFCRSPEELSKVKKIITDAGLLRSPSFKLFMMAEIPTNVIMIDKFIDVGIDGISIGSNDLTMLTLGLDRDNSEIAKDFNELDPAVLWSLKRLVTKAKKRNIMVGICGQAPSNHPDLVQKLVKWGISSISVSPDAIDRTREIIAWAENKRFEKK